MTTGQRNAQTSKGAKNTPVRRIDEPRPEYTAAHARDHEAIARLAYAAWEARGYPHGSPEDDWFWAEEQLSKKQTAGALMPNPTR
jgi:hypothetical protein